MGVVLEVDEVLVVAIVRHVVVSNSKRPPSIATAVWEVPPRLVRRQIGDAVHMVRPVQTELNHEVASVEGCVVEDSSGDNHCSMSSSNRGSVRGEVTRNLA